MLQFLFPALVSGLISLLVTPVVINLAKKWHLVDDPKTRSHPAQTHRGVIPRAGGLPLFAAVFITSLLFLPLNKIIAGILVAGFLTTAIGLWDDRRDLSPYWRFGGNILTALIIVGVGVGIPFITNPFDHVIHLDIWRISFSFLGNHSILVWADLFAILWIVWTMNIVGWSSGVDGQMPGFVAIAATMLGVLALRFSAHDISQTTVATLAFITAGAFAGFLPWNFYPQKIMPGYGGKTLAGLLLSTIAILSGGKIGSALIILAVPMLDAGYILIKRILSKKSPFRADRSHLHHQLLSLGWGKRRIALFYWGVSAILGLLTLTLESQQKFYAFLVLGAVVGGILIWLNFALHQEETS